MSDATAHASYAMMMMMMMMMMMCVQDSLLTAAPPLAAFITGLLAGPAADFVISRRWVSVTVARKLFTLVGRFPVSLACLT